jgi:cytochrome bd-type quinol oxidase subunit 2
MSASPDRKADLAAVWAAVPVVIVALGAVAIQASEGWDAIAFYFLRLFGVVITALVAIAFGVLALTGRTKKKEKASLAVFVSIIAIVAAFALTSEP